MAESAEKFLWAAHFCGVISRHVIYRISLDFWRRDCGQPCVRRDYGCSLSEVRRLARRGRPDRDADRNPLWVIMAHTMECSRTATKLPTSTTRANGRLPRFPKDQM